LYLKLNDQNRVVQTCGIFDAGTECTFKAPEGTPDDPLGLIWNPAKKEWINITAKLAQVEVNKNSSIDTYGNIWVREVIFKKKGEMKMGHKHNFDHIHFLAYGSAKFTIYDGTEFYTTERTAPAWLKVPKNYPHQVEALEDNTAGYCIEALYTDDDKILDSDISFDPKQFDKMIDFTCETSTASTTKITDMDLKDLGD